MYDVQGVDDGREWIEIENTDSEAVDLLGWKLFENNVNHGLSVSQGESTIPSGGFAVIADNSQKFLIDWPDFLGTLFDSSFSLGNSGETFALKNASGASVHTLTYDTSLGARGNGNVLALRSEEWSEQLPTPGISNVPPEIEILPEEEILPDSAGSETLENTTEEETVEGTSDSSSVEEGPNEEILEDAIETENATIPHIVINEIAWMGVPGNHYGEWLEFYNESDSNVSLLGWTLYKDAGTKRVFTLTKTIPAKSFLVLERTTASYPDPLPNIADEAGVFGDGGFSNLPGGEHLSLIDTEGRVVDAIDFSAGWPAGDNDTKKTMQKIENGWITASPTPGKSNAYNPMRSARAEVTVIDDSAPPFIEAVPHISLVNIQKNEIPLVLHDTNLSELSFSFVYREENIYLAITNPKDVFIALSNVTVDNLGKKFVIPTGTQIAPFATAVISHPNAQLARASWALLVERNIVIE
jgi:hypothetical protein